MNTVDMNTTGLKTHNNFLLKTDSYKLTHWLQYPEGTQGVFSYFECRKGSTFNSFPWFGLQFVLLSHLVGKVFTEKDILEAEMIAKHHFGSANLFNKQGWYELLERHGGKLPVRIRALPEGTIVKPGVALFTIEGTDEDRFPWLVNPLETLTMQTWYPTTVCALSYNVKKLISKYLKVEKESEDMLSFMLQDFGFRGASSFESAGIGGAAHLVNFLGTDTLAAMENAHNFYGAPWEGLAYSVPATEHSVMTAGGREYEEPLVGRLLKMYPTGSLSTVADSYDVYNFTSEIIGTKYHDEIMARDGVVVVRPDSVTPQHPDPATEMVELAYRLWDKFGGHVNEAGYKVLDKHVRLLWGDGIDITGIENIMYSMHYSKFSVTNIACFGMGGGLLQKVNRDTQRCALKASAQKRDGVWHDCFKEPLDVTKKSLRGRLKTIRNASGELETVREEAEGKDEMITVFENGELVNFQTFAEIRARAALG